MDFETIAQLAQDCLDLVDEATQALNEGDRDAAADSCGGVFELLGEMQNVME